MNKRKDVQEQITVAENEFLQCWETLASLQRGDIRNEELARTIISFQPKLAKAQYRLAKLYNSISQERRALIARKKTLNPKWFDSRLRSLDSYKNLLRSAVDIGKIIGDGFAWLFYQKEKHLIRQHYAENLVPLVPTGIGGKGEITFVEKAPKFGSYFVLLHSITSFLRLGDISLIDLSRHRVAGIGELKSHSTDEVQMSIRVMLMGAELDRNQLPKSVGPLPETAPQMTLSASAEARLQRQLKKISSSVAPTKSPRLPSPGEIRTAFDYSGLIEMFKNRRKLKWSAERISNGLGVIGVPIRGESLFARLSGRSVSNHQSKTAGVVDVAKALVDKNLSHNSIHIDAVLFSAECHYELLLGMRPIFWWPIPLEMREAIVFRRWHLMTIFNAAFLIAELSRAGLSVTVGRPISGIEKVLEDGRRLTLFGISNYLRLIRQHLVPERTVAELIVRSIDAASVVKNGTVNFDFDFQYH